VRRAATTCIARDFEVSVLIAVGGTSPSIVVNITSTVSDISREIDVSQVTFFVSQCMRKSVLTETNVVKSDLKVNSLSKASE